MPGKPSEAHRPQRAPRPQSEKGVPTAVREAASSLLPGKKTLPTSDGGSRPRREEPGKQGSIRGKGQDTRQGLSCSGSGNNNG